MRIGEVRIFSHSSRVPRDVEVWVSNSGPKDGFTRVAAVKLADVVGYESSIRFDPVEARYVKLRLLRTFLDEEFFEVGEIKVMEAPRAGYTPLLARHPELNGPSPGERRSRGRGGRVFSHLYAMRHPVSRPATGRASTFWC